MSGDGRPGYRRARCRPVAHSYTAAMTPEDLSAAGLRYAVDGAVATVTLDRPDVRNAQTPRMWRALASDRRRDPRRGACGRAAGGGPELLGRARPGDARPGVAQGRAWSPWPGCWPWATTRSRRPSTTTSGASPGCATRGSSRSRSCRATPIGAGFQLALSCDLRVVGRRRQVLHEGVRARPGPRPHGNKTAGRGVGYARALEICATARVVGAAEALEIGLATVVCPVAELDAVLGRPGGGPDRGPARVRSERPRRCCWRRPSRTLDEQRRHEREAQIRRFRELAPLMTRRLDRGEERGMSSLHAQAWRTMHRDDSVVENKIERATLRRVLRFARPHRRLIALVPGLHRGRRRAGRRTPAARAAAGRRRHQRSRRDLGGLAGRRRWPPPRSPTPCWASPAAGCRA